MIQNAYVHLFTCTYTSEQCRYIFIALIVHTMYIPCTYQYKRVYTGWEMYKHAHTCLYISRNHVCVQTYYSIVWTRQKPVACTEFIQVCTGMHHAIVWYQYNWHEQGCTLYISFTPSMYLVHTFFLKYVPVCTWYKYVQSTYLVCTSIKWMFSGTYFGLKACTI
jgi:hypothetical protein